MLVSDTWCFLIREHFIEELQELSLSVWQHWVFQIKEFYLIMGLFFLGWSNLYGLIVSDMHLRYLVCSEDFETQDPGTLYSKRKNFQSTKNLHLDVDEK